METVAFYNTLETFTLSGTNYINIFAFSENVNSDGITNIFFNGIIAEFFREFLWSCRSFCEVILFGFCRVFICLVAE